MICEFCKRDVSNTTRHHLIPKATHSKKKVKRKFSKNEMHETIDVCCDCHKTFHEFCSEMTLAIRYNTLRLLNSHKHLARFKKWIIKQKQRGRIK